VYQTIVLSSSKIFSFTGPKPYLNECFVDKKFVDFVEKSWRELVFHGRPTYVLKEKLKNLKGSLKWWNKES